MAIELNTSIEIKASPEKVWEVLTDFKKFPEWNPFITAISGEQRVGGKLAITVSPANRKPMSFKPKVLVYEPNKELRWLGTGPIPGLFAGEHYFIFKDQGDKGVLFEHGEKFRGLLVGFMPKLFDDTRIGFERMNQALKERCKGTQ